MVDFIYARQSVDKEDSISIESQIELCLREVGNNQHKVFRDKGYSGKNTERPDFQEMMAEVRAGGVGRTDSTVSAGLCSTSPTSSASSRSMASSLCPSQNGSIPQPPSERLC